MRGRAAPRRGLSSPRRFVGFCAQPLSSHFDEEESCDDTVVISAVQIGLGHGRDQIEERRRERKLKTKFLFGGSCQFLVVRIHDEHCKQLCRFRLARIATDWMARARRLVKAFADVIDPTGPVIHLRLNIS